MRYQVVPRGRGFEVVDTFTRTNAVVFESASKRACIYQARKRNGTIKTQPTSRAALAQAQAETA